VSIRQCRINSVKAVATQSPCSGPASQCADKKLARTRVRSKKNLAQLARFADMLAAMGTEPRLRIVQLLLTAHPDGMTVGEIQAETAIAPSTLSHHLEKLRNEGLVKVRRDKKFLWYTSNTAALEDLLSFLFAECCSRSKVVKPETILSLCSGD
jgi:ArsR family transcriptional regulator, arsenate/arsenite/antimonite-responsive transcriptional repressor